MVNAVKVYKKSAPNGKLTVYLGRRDFVDDTNTTQPIDGVVVVDPDYTRGRQVYAAVVVTYRHGREEDEVMGLNFSKEMQISTQAVFPSALVTPNEVQDRLIKKLGGNAFPFMVTLPENAPTSVQLQTAAGTSKPVGVIYELRVFVGESADERPHRRNSVNLAVRKVQFMPATASKRQPSTLVSKGFTLSSGKLNLEVTLDKEVFHHGEQVSATVNVGNSSKKTVKHLNCSIIQHVEMTMTNNHFTREVASLCSKEGCPITPGSSLHKTFNLMPVFSTNKAKGGVALDGKTKDSDANLASSTLVAAGSDPNESTGIIISYSVRIRANCGAIGGELVADLPFKLTHPALAGSDATPVTESNIVFEDFANTRRGMSVDQP